MNSEQDLDRFFERDIIEFLDKEAEGQGMKEVETVRRLLSQRKSGDVDKYLEKLIDEFNTLPKDNPYKDILFNRLIDIAGLIRSYLNKTSWDSELGRIVKYIDDNKLLEGETPDTLDVYKNKRKKKEQLEKQRIEKAYKIKEKLDQKIQETSKNLFISLRKKDLSHSMRNYKVLKTCFEEYPSRFSDDKKNLYSDLLAAYAQVKRLKKEKYEETKKPESKEIDLKTTSSEEVHKITIDEINNIIQKVKKDTKEAKFQEAKQKLLGLKENISKIPDEYKKLRSILESKINILGQRVDFAKRVYERKKEVEHARRSR